MKAARHGLSVAAVVFLLFGYWFAVADRYRIFLYDHDMGSGFDTSPLGEVTVGRYRMAGLVAAGAVLVLYTAANWAAGRLWPRYVTPALTQVWLWAAVPLGVGLPAITMSANTPGLPARLALETTAVTLAGLALALAPAQLAVHNSTLLLWLATEGIGPALLLLAAPALPNVPAWLQEGRLLMLAFLTAGLVAAGLITLAAFLAQRLVHRRSGCTLSTWRQVFVAACCLAYLLFALIHHVAGTDGYFYITSQDNMFAHTMAGQFTTWLGVAAFVWLSKRLLRDAPLTIERNWGYPP